MSKTKKRGLRPLDRYIAVWRRNTKLVKATVPTLPPLKTIWDEDFTTCARWLWKRIAETAKLAEDEQDEALVIKCARLAERLKAVRPEPIKPQGKPSKTPKGKAAVRVLAREFEDMMDAHPPIRAACGTLERWAAKASSNLQHKLEALQAEAMKAKDASEIRAILNRGQLYLRGEVA